MSESKKSGGFRKFLKIVLWVLAAIILMIAIMPLWISPVATTVANCLVPKYTGTAFHIKKLVVNPWTCSVRIGDVKLSNPEGFGDSPAFSVKSVFVDVAPFALFSNKLHIEDFVVEDPFVSYFSHDGANNIDVILGNLNAALGIKDKEEAEEEEKEEKDDKEEMKIIIDHFRVSGTKVKLMENDVIPPLPIMTIDLEDIGKESGGATLEEAWKSVSDAFMKGMSSIGDGLGALGGIISDGAKGLGGILGDGASGAADATKNAAGAVSDGAKSAAGAVSDGAKSAAGAVNDGAKSAAGAVSDGAKAAAGAVGDGAKAAAGAVGDGAKAAVDGVKNLFK